MIKYVARYVAVVLHHLTYTMSGDTEHLTVQSLSVCLVSYRCSSFPLLFLSRVFVQAFVYYAEPFLLPVLFGCVLIKNESSFWGFLCFNHRIIFIINNLTLKNQRGLQTLK